MITQNLEPWPELPYDAWRETRETLHRWTQIVGKVRLARMPMTDGWWQVPLYVTARGLTTSPIPAGRRTFQLDFDILAHELLLLVSDGTKCAIGLYPRSVANFYEEFMAMLASADLATKIWPTPVELLDPHPTPFDRDVEHVSYNADAVLRWWTILTQVDQILKEFSAGFVGRVSPSQFFWGTFDLAVSRYSGRRIPPKQGANVIERYAFDMEQVECGFWPGDERLKAAAFYSFTVPPPDDYAGRPISPAAARYDQKLGEFILLYDDVRQSQDPKRTLLEFFSSTYDVGARPPAWNRHALDWSAPRSDASRHRD